MAKTSTVDLFKQRLEEVTAEKEKQEAAVMKLQDKLRPDPYNADLRRKVQDAKNDLGKLNNEHSELSRSIATASGATNHFPPPDNMQTATAQNGNQASQTTRLQ
jgi:hypothetical protein